MNQSLLTLKLTCSPALISWCLYWIQRRRKCIISALYIWHDFTWRPQLCRTQTTEWEGSTDESKWARTEHTINALTTVTFSNKPSAIATRMETGKEKVADVTQMEDWWWDRLPLQSNFQTSMSKDHGGKNWMFPTGSGCRYSYWKSRALAYQEEVWLTNQVEFDGRNPSHNERLISLFSSRSHKRKENKQISQNVSSNFFAFTDHSEATTVCVMAVEWYFFNLAFGLPPGSTVPTKLKVTKASASAIARPKQEEALLSPVAIPRLSWNNWNPARGGGKEGTEGKW